MHRLIIIKSQKAKEKTIAFRETLPIFPMSSLSTLAYELMKNIRCDLCQQKTSNQAMVIKHIMPYLSS